MINDQVSSTYETKKKGTKADFHISEALFSLNSFLKS